MSTKQQSSTQRGLLSNELAPRESNSSAEERDLAAARNQLNLIGKAIQAHYERRKNLTPHESIYACNVGIDAFGNGHITVQFAGSGKLQGNIKGVGAVAGDYVGTAEFINEPPSDTTYVHVVASFTSCEVNFIGASGVLGTLNAAGPISAGGFQGGGSVVWRA